jgi:alkylation response protein AidB-like acyl-CoA dehydrogenase
MISSVQSMDDSDTVIAGSTTVTLSALRTSGVLGILVPTEYGGLGGDAVTANRAIADIARTDPSLAIVAFQHLAVTARIVEWGTTEQHRALLPLLASADWVAASAWSETGAGAAKQNLATVAEQHESDSWTLSGVKSFVTGAGLADLYLVLAQTACVTDSASTYGSAGQTFFLVPADTPGLDVGRPFDLDGMRASATGTVRLDGCTVGEHCVLGTPGAAATIIASVRESGVTLGAVSLGIAEAAYDIAAKHCRDTGSLAHQVTRNRLVDMTMRLEAIRACIERAGRRESTDPGATTLYSKLYGSSAAEQMCQEALTLLGSAGYARSHPINGLARDARAIGLMGPTNDLCRELVSASWAA